MEQENYFTPVELATRVRRVLLGIDLDPASCSVANRLLCAKRFYGKEENGLVLPWGGAVYLNPPGGRENKGKKHLWWRRALEHFSAGGVVVYAGFTTEHLALQPPPQFFPTVVLQRRVCWLVPRPGCVHERCACDRVERAGKPRNLSFFTLLGGDSGHLVRFRRNFWQLGPVIAPTRARPRRNLQEEVARAMGQWPNVSANGLVEIVAAERSKVLAIARQLRGSDGDVP